MTREGPPRYYIPVCERIENIGYVGGPRGYQRRDEADKDVGPCPIVVQREEEPEP